MIYDYLVKNTFKIFGKIFYRYKVIGRKNFPLRGGALLIANHISYLDSVLIAGWTPKMVRFVLLKQIYEGSLHWLFRRVKIIPVSARYSHAKMQEFNERCREMIRSGELVYIYSEGEMSRINNLLRFKKGLEYIAKGQDFDVIPIHYDNTTGSPMTYEPGTGETYKFKIKNFQRTIIVNIGEPIPHPVTAYRARLKMLELSAESFFRRLNENDNIYRVTRKLLRKRKSGKDNFPLAKKILQGINKKYQRLIAYYLLSFNQVLKYEPGLEIRQEGSTLFDVVFKKFIPFVLQKHVSLELGYWCLPGNFAIVSMNIPDLDTKDVTGHRIIQRNHKKYSVGRPLPGIAVKTVNLTNYDEVMDEGQPGILMVKGFVIDCNPEINKQKNRDGWYNTGVTGSIDEDGFIHLQP